MCIISNIFINVFECIKDFCNMSVGLLHVFIASLIVIIFARILFEKLSWFKHRKQWEPFLSAVLITASLFFFADPSERGSSTQDSGQSVTTTGESEIKSPEPAPPAGNPPIATVSQETANGSGLNSPQERKKIELSFEIKGKESIVTIRQNDQAPIECELTDIDITDKLKENFPSEYFEDVIIILKDEATIDQADTLRNALNEFAENNKFPHPDETVRETQTKE